MWTTGAFDAYQPPILNAAAPTPEFRKDLEIRNEDQVLAVGDADAALGFMWPRSPVFNQLSCTTLVVSSGLFH
jgi:hypothetical protein